MESASQREEVGRAQCAHALRVRPASRETVGDARTLYPQSVAVNASAKTMAVGVPYGSRTRVAAVKEKRPVVIQMELSGVDST
jgi:hypothetical protein